MSCTTGPLSHKGSAHRNELPLWMSSIGQHGALTGSSLMHGPPWTCAQAWRVPAGVGSCLTSSEQPAMRVWDKEGQCWPGTHTSRHAWVRSRPRQRVAACAWLKPIKRPGRHSWQWWHGSSLLLFVCPLGPQVPLPAMRAPVAGGHGRAKKAGQEDEYASYQSLLTDFARGGDFWHWGTREVQAVVPGWYMTLHHDCISLGICLGCALNASIKQTCHEESE